MVPSSVGDEGSESPTTVLESGPEVTRHIGLDEQRDQSGEEGEISPGNESYERLNETPVETREER